MAARSTGAARALIAALALCAVSGCAASASGPRLQFGLVTDVGGLGDQSFNDSAFRGLQEAGRRFDARIAVLDSRSAPDYQPSLAALANGGYAEVVAVGFLMADDLAEVARRHPRGHFAIVDAVVDAPNIASVTFKDQDGSFLAGALAAQVSRTRTVAFLGGIDIPLLRQFEAGFTAGAREIDPRIRVLVKYVGSFDDVASGKELADVLYDQGADVVFAAAGKAGLGAIEAARERPRDYAIGVDSDQDGLAPGKVLTSMVKRVDVAVLRICAAAAAGHPPHGHLELGLREGGVGLTDFRYTRALVGPAIRARLERLRQAIVAGRLRVPATRPELARFRPIPL